MARLRRPHDASQQDEGAWRYDASFRSQHVVLCDMGKLAMACGDLASGELKAHPGVTTSLNKKVLCFVDEYGTAGATKLYLGAVLVLARDAGRVDRCFTNFLEPNANEVHAADLDDVYLQGLMYRFWEAAPQTGS